MDVSSHLVSQGLVDQLVLLDHILSGKYIAYDDCREVRSITLHLNLTALISTSTWLPLPVRKT